MVSRQSVESVLLTALAGAVDAIGYIRLGGLFVAFMSGNSTELAVSLVRSDHALAGAAAGLIACFVFGVTLGSGLARTAGRWHRGLLLGLEAAMLATVAAIDGPRTVVLSAGLMATAMGLENASFADDRGRAAGSLTFVTGTLVRLGDGLAAACLGGEPWGWAPHLLRWAALVGGAMGGVAVYAAVGIPALYGISAILATLAAIGLVFDPAPKPA